MDRDNTTAFLRGHLSDRLEAHLGPPKSLRFHEGHEPLGVPGHVRAGSAVRRWGQRLVVVQDDVHALALLDEVEGTITPLALPPGADGGRVFSQAQGNKALKMDLEACITLSDGRLVAFGSGSTPAREQVVVVSSNGSVRVHDGAYLYAGLRECPDFSGSELNIEGAVVQTGTLLLFQRGNGATLAGRAAVNAVGSLDLPAFLRWLDGESAPTLRSIRQVDLGEHGAVRFGFTDACVIPDGRVAFLAGAEDSPDTYRDGEVVGARFGILDGDDIPMSEVLENGQASRQKLEGIEFVDEDEDGMHFVVVTDMDSPDLPTTLHTLTVRAPTPGDASLSTS